MRLWFLTNGFGEDRAAALVASELRARRSLEVVAAPLVTPGGDFAARGIRVVTPGVTPPSGGFPMAGPWVFVRDLPAVPRYFGYVHRLRRMVGSDDRFVAAGDVFLTGLGRLAFGRPGVHVALAKSVHGRPHSALECALLRRWTHVVFARDEATAAHLQSRGVRALFLGNPLIDGPQSGNSRKMGSDPIFQNLRVLLLPGSRREAGANLVRLLDVAARVGESADWACAWPGAIAIERGIAAAAQAGWVGRGNCLCRDDTVVAILTGCFEELLARADLVVGLAGTANEQAAAMGKPVITFVGCGPQTTAARMAEQERLLGGAARMVRGDLAAVAEAVSHLLRDPDERRRMAEMGIARLGPTGAAARIAERLIEEVCP